MISIVEHIVFIEGTLKVGYTYPWCMNRFAKALSNHIFIESVSLRCFKLRCPKEMSKGFQSKTVITISPFRSLTIDLRCTLLTDKSLLKPLHRHPSNLLLVSVPTNQAQLYCNYFCD